MNCPGCLNDFEPIRRGQHYCSKRCSRRVRNRAERRQAKEADANFDHERAREAALRARALQVMAEEPELETWALVERFGVTLETLSRWRKEAANG